MSCINVPESPFHTLSSFHLLFSQLSIDLGQLQGTFAFLSQTNASKDYCYTSYRTAESIHHQLQKR